MSTAYDYVTISNARNRSLRRAPRQPRPVPPPVAPPPAPRPALRRWGSILLLMTGAAVMIGYISNAIAVNRLLSQATQLERSRDSVRTVNEHLRADMLRLMAPERITLIASEQLGMIQSPTPPVELSFTGIK